MSEPTFKPCGANGANVEVDEFLAALGVSPGGGAPTNAQVASAIATNPAAVRAAAGVGDSTTYVLAIGQSNMRRVTSATYGKATYDISNDERVEILKDDNAWATYDLNVTNLSGYLGAVADGNTSTLPYHAGKELARSTGSKVRIAGSSLGAQSLTYWGPSNGAGDGFDETALGWVRILDVISQMPRVDLILFHQGETLGGRTRAQQLSDLKLLFTNIIATGKATVDTPIVAGELFDVASDGNLALWDLDADPTWPQFRVARRPGGVGLNDALHFDANQIAAMGLEMARLISKTPKTLPPILSMGRDRRIAPEAFAAGAGTTPVAYGAGGFSMPSSATSGARPIVTYFDPIGGDSSLSGVLRADIPFSIGWNIRAQGATTQEVIFSVGGGGVTTYAANKASVRAFGCYVINNILKIFVHDGTTYAESAGVPYTFSPSHWQPLILSTDGLGNISVYGVPLGVSPTADVFQVPLETMAGGPSGTGNNLGNAGIVTVQWMNGSTGLANRPFKATETHVRMGGLW